MLSIKNSPQGIDVSDNNGNFDWHAWNGHLDFAMIKASEGPIPDYPLGYHDVQFERNWTMAHEIGIYRFAYHFARPDNHPAHQAHYFANIVEKAGLVESDNMALDLEVIGGHSPLHVSMWADTFRRVFHEIMPHRHLLIYTFPAFADRGNCAALGDSPLWIANYDTPQPHIPAPWRMFAFWQYVGSGLDRDVFNGTDKGLKNFCTREP